MGHSSSLPEEFKLLRTQLDKITGQRCSRGEVHPPGGVLSLRVLHLFSREGSVVLDQVIIPHHADEPKAAQEWIQRVSARFKGLSVLGGDALYADTDLAEAILAQGEDHVVIASRGTTEGEPLTGDDDFRINRWH